MRVELGSLESGDLFYKRVRMSGLLGLCLFVDFDGYDHAARYVDLDRPEIVEESDHTLLVEPTGKKVDSLHILPLTKEP